MIVDEPAAEIVPTEAVKLALADPAPTVTDPGTVSSGLLLDKFTAAPPLGAIPESETPQDADCPELRFEGLHVTAVKVGVGTITEKPTELLTPPIAST